MAPLASPAWRAWRLAVPAAALLLLPGCLAKAALDVATAPVRIAGKAVDLATTSQSEADEKRGRALREREERLGRLERELPGLERRCADGSDEACRKAARHREEIAALLPTIPARAPAR